MSQSIIIAGGGIGGLTAALALLRKGFDVTVVEQASELKEIGAGLHMGPNGTAALFGLGLKDALMKQAVLSVKREMRLWNTGEAWSLAAHGAGSEERYGAPYMLLHRADLHGILRDAVLAIKPDAVLLNSKVTGLEQDESGAGVLLEDGRIVRGAAVVGADGVHSVVRDRLGKSVTPQFTGNMFWRGMIPIELVPERERDSAGGWFSHRATVTCYPVRGGKFLNFVGTVKRDGWSTLSWTEQGTTEECLTDFEGWHPNIIQMIENMGTPYKWGQFQFESVREWTDRRVTLLGDACHAMPPSLGQGAIMAIEDGVVLARALEASKGDIIAGLQRYQAARVERATEVVNCSWRESRGRNSADLADPAKASAYMAARFTSSSVNTFYDWIFGYKAHEVNV
ncbi:MAG TPA: FAD-dependent monooxygenase [Pararhizobium sp.]|uniref:FAD-dependent monooxygenase n=1 Tax=Pararhizobium sp. TaxID=1977563 RepID=UPI002BD225E9|nr:FAD-dependent monooxygenase [Pararhizobium sp.]HTO34147.1 FAD-dependent monooxygenase [Pararhizobium sp.]